MGCLNCRSTHTKCGEELDSCFNCLDKSLKCLFLSLSKETKQKIFERNELKRLASTNTANTSFSFKLENPGFNRLQLSRQNSAMTRLKFKNTKTVPALKGLRGHIKLATVHQIIPVIKVVLGTDTESHSVCGELYEASGTLRNNSLTYVYDIINESTSSLVVFYSVMYRAFYTVLNEITKSDRKLGSSHRSISKMRQLGIAYKIKGLDLAARGIEYLNTKFKGFKFVRVIKALIYYSLAAFCASFISDSSFSIVSTFVNGVINITTIKVFMQRINQVLAQGNLTPARYEYAVKTRELMMSINARKLSTIKYIYVPNYNLQVLREFSQQLGRLKALLFLHFSPRAAYDLQQLENIINRQVLQNRKLTESYNSSNISSYNIGQVFQVLQNFIKSYPSEATFLNERLSCVAPVDRMCYVSWYAASVILDSVFQESAFLFSASFFAAFQQIHGFGARVLEGLVRLLAQVLNPPAYAQAYEIVTYLSRVTSFLRIRYRLIETSLTVLSPYPGDGTAFESVRYRSRKLKSLKEVQIVSFTNQLILRENYFSHEESLLPELLELTHPYHVHWDAGVQVSSKYKYDVQNNPGVFRRLDKYGLFDEVDYRPQVREFGATKQVNGDAGEVLERYIDDRKKILSSALQQV